MHRNQCMRQPRILECGDSSPLSATGTCCGGARAHAFERAAPVFAPPAESLRQTRRSCKFGHYVCATDVNCWTLPAFSCQEAVFRVYILSVFLCFHTHSRIDLRFNIFMPLSPASAPDVAPAFRACPEQRERVGTYLPREFLTCTTGGASQASDGQSVIQTPTAGWQLPSSAISIEFRPSVPDPGIPPCGLRKD